MNSACKTKKCESIMVTAKALFWKHGIRRITIEEICREAQVSKMTFYNYFPNKTELVKAIFLRISESSAKKFEEITASDAPFTEKISQLILLKLNASKDISTELIKDIYQNPSLELAQFMDELKEQNLGLFIRFFDQSQKSGSIRKDIKIEFLLAYLNQSTELMENRELLSKYEHPHDLIMELTRFIFYGLMPKNSVHEKS